MLVTCPKVVKNKDKTFAQYLKMFGITNPEIEMMFQVFSGMCGLPNDRVSALLTVGVMYSLREKAYRPAGSFCDLPQKLEKRFIEMGGELRLKTEVERILTENGVVQGVVLKDGSIIHSRNVISTIDAKVTIGNLVGLESIHPPHHGYAKKVASVKMTTSCFSVNLGLDNADILTKAGLPCGYGLITMGNDAYAKLFPSLDRNEFKVAKDCFYLGYSCPPPAPQREPVLTIQAVPVPVGNWSRLRETDRAQYRIEKEKTADILMDIFAQYLLPDLRQHSVVKDISSPATFARYSGSPTGSIYDMAVVPDNFGANRLR